MRQIEADALMSKIRSLSNDTMLLGVYRDQEMFRHGLERCEATVDELTQLCDDNDLPMSVKALTRIKQLITLQRTGAKLDADGLQRGSQICATTLEDELSARLCFLMEPSEAKAWDKKRAFGEKVSDSFPSTDFEIEEETKCYAIGRYTAAVFHLMRVVDIGLSAFAVSIGADPANKSWEKVLQQIQVKLDENSASKAPDWKETEKYYSELSAHFRTLKNAWRNYTMHGAERYDKDRCEDIFGTVRALMKALAERVEE